MFKSMIIRTLVLLALVVKIGYVFATETLQPMNNIAEKSTSAEDTLDTGEDTAENTQESGVFDLLKNDTQLPTLNQKEPIQPSKSDFVELSIAKVIALNKITATSREITLKTKESKYFGNIEIKVHRCLKNTDLYSPDNKILLTITEKKIDEDEKIVFQGWMMSSNISITNFEHPVYEIFAKNCL